MGTDLGQITTLVVVLTQKAAREENLRPFTSSPLTETQPRVMERAWAWVPDRPGLESALCTHQPGALSMALTSPNLFCALYGQVNNVPLTGLAVRNK